MRISYWSSDVCSSDLDGPAPEIVRLRPPSPLATAANRASGRAIPADLISTLHRNLDRFRALDALVVPETTSLLLQSLFGLKSLKLVQIGRASCRERVGQYVKISVVAVTLKKTNNKK